MRTYTQLSWEQRYQHSALLKMSHSQIETSEVKGCIILQSVESCAEIEDSWATDLIQHTTWLWKDLDLTHKCDL